MDRLESAFESGRSSPPPGSPEDARAEPGATGDPSLVDDLETLVEDGRTYLEAELAFQRSRAAYAGDGLKWAAIHGAAALGLVHLALIALTIGLILALAPITGPWLATAIVVGVLLLGAYLLVARVRARLSDLSSLFGEGKS